MDHAALSFEDIRPYRDEEVPAIMQRVTERPTFPLLMSYLYPEVPPEAIAQQMRQVRNVAEFQHTYISHAVNHIVRDSITELTHEGLAALDPQQSYLFLSNHRDIILDSALLNVLRWELKHPTTEIAIGDNLMITPLITDLMKLNKSFIVHRHPPRQQAYAYSQRLSHYIRSLIGGQRSSVWLAQRNGRTKDGCDLTQASLLKMLQLSGSDEDLSASFKALRIVPLAISYEFEPCDYLKAEELLHQSKGLPYQKNDRQAIIEGIREPKGRVHVAAGQPLAAEIDALSPQANRNDWLRAMAWLIDAHIHRLYRRWPIQYAAYDRLHGGDRMADYYSVADQEQLEVHLRQRLQQSRHASPELETMICRIYAGMIEADLSKKASD